MADTINVQNDLDQDIVVYDSYTANGDQNYFGALTSLGTVKAKSSSSVTPIHSPVCVLIAMDANGKPIGRYISMFNKKDITVSQTDIAAMALALKFVDAITSAPHSDLAKQFNDVLNAKTDQIQVQAINDFFAKTQDYQSCTFQIYMLALTYRARNPKQVPPSTTPVEQQPYSLARLCQALGGTWPDGFPDILVTHFKCGTKNNTLFLAGHLTVADLPFENSEIGRHVLTLVPINQVEAEFFFHYGLDPGIFGIRMKFIAPDFHIPIAGGKSMVIKKPTVELDIDPKFMFVVFKAYATIPFNILDRKFDAKITMVLDNIEIEIGAVIDGDHSSLPAPPICRGLHLDEFGVGMGIIFEPPSVAVGLQGKFHIGSGDAMVALDDDTFALVCAFEEGPEGIPVPNPLYLAFNVPKLDLSTLINLFTDLDIDLGLPVNIQNLTFQWAENPMEPVALPDGSLTQMAFGCSGYLELLKLQFYGSLEINLKGVEGTLTMDPLKMGHIFSLAGDGKGIRLKVDADGNLIKNNQIPKTKKEQAAIANAKLKQIVQPGGPEITVSTSSSPYFSLSCDVNLLGLMHADIETRISNKGISFELDYGAILEGMMKCVLQDYHNLGADFKYGINLDVPLPTIAGFSLGHIHLECGCSAGFSVKTSMSDITLEVHGSFDFQGITINFGPYSVDIDISGITGLIKAIGAAIIKDAEHLFSNFIDDAGKWAKWVARGVISGVEDVAKALKEAFHKGANEVAKILKGAGYLIEDVGDAIARVFGLSSGGVGSALSAAGFSQEQIEQYQGGKVMPDNNASKIMWSQFTQEIAAQLGDGATEAAIQILPTAHFLYGDNAKDLAQSISIFAATLPQWGAIYEPSTSTLINAYPIIMTQIKETATISGKEDDYKAENKKLEKMMGQAGDYKADRINSWLTISQKYSQAGLTPPSFPDWFKTNGLQEYRVLLEKQQQQTDIVSALTTESPLIAALSRMNAELTECSDVVAPPVTINPDAQMLMNWTTTPTDPGSISFTDGSTHYDYSKTVWTSQSGGSLLFGFISLGHHDKTHTQESIVSDSSTYHLKIDFAAQAAVDVQQGSWFDGDILREYKNGPWIEGSQFDKALAHPYGQKGILPLLATRIYVVMNPTITIELDQSTYSKFTQQMQSSGGTGIHLGPFVFGGSIGGGSSTHTTIDTDDQSHKVTCTDKSNIPQIIAVVNQVMP